MPYISRFMWKRLFLIEAEIQLEALFPPLLTQLGMEITTWQRRGHERQKREFKYSGLASQLEVGVRTTPQKWLPIQSITWSLDIFSLKMPLKTVAD